LRGMLSPEDLRKEANYPIWVRLRSGDRAARDELVAFATRVRAPRLLEIAGIDIPSPAGT